MIVGDKMMKRETLFTLLIYIVFIGPGPMLLFINSYTVTLIPLASLILVIYVYRRAIYSSLDLRDLAGKESLTTIFNGIRLSILAFALNYVISKFLLFTPGDLNQTNSLLVQYPMMVFNVILVGPVFEELVYRRIILDALAKKVRFWPAAVISSLMFAAVHLDVQTLPVYFLLGLILCHVARKSQHLGACIAVHSVINLISVMVATLHTA